VKPNLPPGTKLKVIRWLKDQMHNRYIITDRGGVIFGHGLNCDYSHPVGYDTVSLLDDKTCEELRIEYSQKSKRLTWQNDVFITG
jgi:hypothetical protein